MSASPPSPGGWLESLRRMGESSFALLRSRFELFTVEWQEERVRLLDLLLWLSLACRLRGRRFSRHDAPGVMAVADGGLRRAAAVAALTVTVGVTMLWRLHRKLQRTPRRSRTPWPSSERIAHACEATERTGRAPAPAGDGKPTCIAASLACRYENLRGRFTTVREAGGLAAAWSPPSMAGRSPGSSARATGGTWPVSVPMAWTAFRWWRSLKLP